MRSLLQKIEADKLFNLFSNYGNIVRIKILHNKPDHALIQMGDGFQAELAFNYLKVRRVWKHLRLPVVLLYEAEMAGRRTLFGSLFPSGDESDALWLGSAGCDAVWETDGRELLEACADQPVARHFGFLFFSSESLQSERCEELSVLLRPDQDDSRVEPAVGYRGGRHYKPPVCPRHCDQCEDF